MEGEDGNTVLPREAFNFLPHLQQVCTGRRTHTHTHSRSQQILKHLFTKLQSFQGHQDLKNKRHFRRFPTLDLWK